MEHRHRVLYTSGSMCTLQRLRLVLILLLAVALGCAWDGMRGASAASTGLAQSSTQPSGAVTIHLVDAVAATDLETGDWELDMQSQIPFKDRPIYFGQLATYDNDQKATATVPVVGFKSNGRLMALKIDDSRLVNASWSYIAAGPTTPEFWGVLDASLDDHQPQIVIAHSMDSGDTLQIASLAKPLPAAVFDSFCMDRLGHGRLSLYVYRDQGKLREAGYYNYRTTDGGKTWSGPEHELDGMLPADDAPDDVANPPEKPAKV
jgi:hypothetical protein